MALEVEHALAVISRAVETTDPKKRSGLHLALECLQSGLSGGDAGDAGGPVSAGGVSSQSRKAGCVNSTWMFRFPRWSQSQVCVFFYNQKIR